MRIRATQSSVSACLRKTRRTTELARCVLLQRACACAGPSHASLPPCSRVDARSRLAQPPRSRLLRTTGTAPAPQSRNRAAAGEQLPSPLGLSPAAPRQARRRAAIRLRWPSQAPLRASAAGGTLHVLSPPAAARLRRAPTRWGLHRLPPGCRHRPQLLREKAAHGFVGRSYIAAPAVAAHALRLTLARAAAWPSCAATRRSST